VALQTPSVGQEYQGGRPVIFSASPRRWVCLRGAPVPSARGRNWKCYSSNLTRSHNDPTREASEPKIPRFHGISGWVERILVPQPNHQSVSMR
jgi:hypothetical protein